MKRNIIKVNLGSRDDVLKMWFKLVSERTTDSISSIVNCAVIYYGRTGTYMNIGNITDIDDTLKDTRKPIYFSQDSEALQVLKKVFANQKEASALKRIIRRGISETVNEGNYVITEEEALDEIQKLSVSEQPKAKTIIEEAPVKENENLFEEPIVEPIVIPQKPVEKTSKKEDFMLSFLDDNLKLRRN